ncbi:hypothetical protein BYT27DRAFT_7181630 [Phlegmacium glaucopus]|nr:hypothetical protein BYT27DRAFT_7181630 [Phlegmacium glaucopus]
MSRTTLDITGLAGFNRNFNALTSGPEKNTLLKSFSTISKAGCQPTIIPLLSHYSKRCISAAFLSSHRYSSLNFFTVYFALDCSRHQMTEMREASAIMCRIRSDLLKQSKASHEDDECNKLPARSVTDEE